MIVKFVKIKGKGNKYQLVLKPKTKREKKVIRAIALATCDIPYVIGSGPAFLGKDSQIYLRTIPTPSIREKEYKAVLETYKEPPWSSIHEVQQTLILDKKIEDNLDYRSAMRTESLASQYKLMSIIPKSLRAKHTCRCGTSYKKRSKLVRHQEYCTVLAAERENFAHVEAIQALLNKPAKKGNSEGKSSTKKKKQSSRQPVSDTTKTDKRKRKKTPKASKR